MNNETGTREYQTSQKAYAAAKKQAAFLTAKTGRKHNYIVEKKPEHRIASMFSSVWEATVFEAK
jgi:hypothetical protein